MPHIRLIGLVLFVTAILLTFAAAISQTSHIRIKRPEAWTQAGEAAANNATTDSRAPDNPSGSDATKSPVQIEFVSIPIIWPLLVAGGMGLLLWFSTASLQPKKSPRRKRRIRRK